MKALSIRQPWADCIIYGGKDIENRPWPTRFRGTIFVHAPKSFDREGWLWLNDRIGNLARPEDFKTGGIVGTVKIVDCVTEYESAWFSGPYGFVLSEPEHFPFYECKGKLGLFEIDFDRRGIDDSFNLGKLI